MVVVVMVVVIFFFYNVLIRLLVVYSGSYDTPTHLQPRENNHTATLLLLTQILEDDYITKLSVNGTSGQKLQTRLARAVIRNIALDTEGRLLHVSVPLPSGETSNLVTCTWRISRTVISVSC